MSLSDGVMRGYHNLRKPHCELTISFDASLLLLLMLQHILITRMYLLDRNCLLPGIRVKESIGEYQAELGSENSFFSSPRFQLLFVI